MKLSQAGVADFADLLGSFGCRAGSATLQGAAQAFVDEVYGRFDESLLLLRLFASLPYAALSSSDRALVDRKGGDSGNADLITESTPVLTLLGTRGMEPEWNDRTTSAVFRCIPLFSSSYVASLSMLAMQFRQMNLDLFLLDAWGDAVVAQGRADRFRGMLFVQDSARDKDELGRMIVPRQDFVTRYGVKTSLGFGAGYSGHPAIVTLFAFTNETLEKEKMTPFADLLEAFVLATGVLAAQGAVM